MATSSTYYLNGPSLGSSTAIYTDSELSICAPNGFYSDGVISREQVDCILLPQQTCPQCAVPCGGSISGSGSQGIYLLNLDTGTTPTDVGAVIVRFDPYSVPDGIRATYDNVVYNKLTSPIDGLHQSSNTGHFTYVGDTAGDCVISGTTYPLLPEFAYNGTSFVSTGGTQSVTVSAGDVSLNAGGPGSCMMVIPKINATPNVVNFEMVGPCSGTAWVMSVACPVLLTGFSSSVVAASSTAVCLLTETTIYYNASLAGTPGIVGLYDFVYEDEYGSIALSAGYYLALGSVIGGNDWFQVNTSGIVISLGTCSSLPSATINISNFFFAGTITDVKVNGVSVSGATFPLAGGGGTAGTTTEIGTHDIEVFFSGVTLNSHITTIDSTSTSVCSNMMGSGSQVFTSQVIDGIVDVSIDCNDSNC